MQMREDGSGLEKETAGKSTVAVANWDGERCVMVKFLCSRVVARSRGSRRSWASSCAKTVLGIESGARVPINGAGAESGAR
jgi:hypothetical protein